MINRIKWFFSTGPEIDPFWYVGRGVRPIGRFGKRESDAPFQQALLLLLLSALRNTQNERIGASSPNTDYYSEVHKSFTWTPIITNTLLGFGRVLEQQQPII